ncbi:MAG TPA: hypothetical protein VLR45_01650 [Desulfoprunum sp.]|nr:hypothetical protein [Desulfoprunum sp.]
MTTEALPAASRAAETIGIGAIVLKDQKRRKILCMPEDVKEVTIGGGKSRDPERDPPVDHSGPGLDSLIAV